MQFNHRGLTFRADIGAQSCRFAAIRETVDDDILVSDNIDRRQKDHPTDQRGWNTQEPDQTIVACDHLTAIAIKGHSGCFGWVHQRIAKGIGRIEEGQQDPWQKRCLEQCAHRQNRRFTQEG